MKNINRLRGVCFFLAVAAIANNGWVQAQKSGQGAEQEICEDGHVLPSDARKTVDVPELGIRVDIPENYVVEVTGFGAHEIISTAMFELLNCVARGGLARGSGRFAERIRIVDNPNGLNPNALIDLAIQGSSFYNQGQRSIYKGGLFDAVAVLAASSMSAGAWLLIPSTQQVLFVEIGCDCEVDLDRLFQTLSTISFL